MEIAPNLPADDTVAVALVAAIRGGDLAALTRLLDGDPGLARARVVDAGGVARTLLHVVADWPGHLPEGPRTVAILVARGADVNAAVIHAVPRGSAETPLHWAASSDDVGVIDALLDGGADIEAPGAVFTGGTPMSDAVVFANWRAARRLRERGARTTLWQAAALGMVDAVRQQVSARPPPSAQEITNAMWHACRGGQLAAAAYLFEQGADPRWVGHDGETPLDVARESGVAELVEWLDGQLGGQVIP